MEVEWRSSAGTPSDDGGHHLFLFQNGVAAVFRALTPSWTLLHSLHHQTQQGGYCLVHISACHRTRLKVGDADETGARETKELTLISQLTVSLTTGLDKKTELNNIRISQELLTRICRPDLEPVGRGHPSHFWDLPLCPPRQCLDCHSRRWPGVDLKGHGKVQVTGTGGACHKWSIKELQAGFGWCWRRRKTLVFINNPVNYWRKRQHVLIQFLTLRKLCWLVKSNISRKPMASLKNAVVRLRNLKITWTAFCTAPFFLFLDSSQRFNSINSMGLKRKKNYMYHDGLFFIIFIVCVY